MVKRCNPLTLLGNGGVGCSEVVKRRGHCASFDSGSYFLGRSRWNEGAQKGSKQGWLCTQIKCNERTMGWI